MPIPLIGPDGQQYELDNPDPAALEEVLRQGYKQQLPKYQPEGLSDTIAAEGANLAEAAGTGAFGALEGITGGLAGLAAGTHSKELGRVIQQQKEEHPIAYGVGEFGGMLASPINKLSGAIKGGIGATTALGRIGAQAVGSGAEGVLFGAGNTMSEAALGDTDLTAEKMIAGIGLGGVLGAAGGGLGAGLTEGFTAVAGKAGELLGRAKGPLSEFADERWLKAGGAIASDIKKIPEAERASVAQVIREAMSPAGKIMPASVDEAAAAVASEREAVARQLLKEVGVGDAGGLLPKMGKDEALEALGRGFKENGDRMGAVLSKADEMGARPSFSGALNRFDELEKSLNPAERDIIENDITKARKYILEMGGAPSGSDQNSFKAMNSLKSTLQGDINWADSGARNNLKKKIVGIIKDELDSQFEIQMGPTLGAEFQSAKAAYGALKNAAKAVKGKNATGADAIAALVKDAELASPGLGGKLSALDHASNLIKHGMDRTLGNRFISPSDYAVGLARGIVGGDLTGLASSIGHKLIREHGSAVVAKLADSITQSPRLMMTAAAFAQQMQQAAPQMGEYAAPLLQAIAHNPATGLATHMAMAQADPGYAEAAKMAGFLPETPEELAHATDKGNHLAAVAHTLDAQNTMISKGLDDVFKGKKAPGAATSKAVTAVQDFGAKRARGEGVAAHKKRVDEIRNLAANPEALIERITANLGASAEMTPAMSAAMTKTANAAVQYLAKESQEPPKPGPLAMGWHNTEAEQHEFSQKLQAVQEPLSVLSHAAAGTLVPAQWEAVQTVYPLLARQIQDMAMERLAAPPKDVPYRSRLMLTMITGIDVDGTFGQSIALNQAAIAAAGSGSSDKPKPADKDAKLTLGKRTATPSQEREIETA